MAAQLASFQVADGYEVNLFADESMGIANPVCFRWDAEGRLWVLCTWAYPQLKPGEPAVDKLFILEDKDQDGKADKVFVTLVRRDKGRILVDGPLQPGDLVVVEGVQGLRPGQAVKTAPFKTGAPAKTGAS